MFRTLITIACLLPFLATAAPNDPAALNNKVAALESALKTLKPTGAQPKAVAAIKKRGAALKLALQKWTHVAVAHGAKSAKRGKVMGLNNKKKDPEVPLSALLDDVESGAKLGNFEIQDLMSKFEQTKAGVAFLVRPSSQPNQAAQKAQKAPKRQ